MDLQQLLQWKRENQDALTAFLHQHRELSGIHFMETDDGSAYVEFSVKLEDDAPEIQEEVRRTFSQLPFQVVTVDPTLR